jgi:phosphoglycerol transferase MdoB-like AlkP superfamily enzyme
MNNDQKPEKADAPASAGSAVKRARQRGPSIPWYGIPWDVGGRIGLLFLVLCLIKVMILTGFRKHLFQNHWRIGQLPEGWLNQVAFYLFVILAGLNLWCFGKKCSTGGVRTIRMANAFVLVLGLFFIFLTFHAGDKNYLYPLLDGTLHWWDLKSYLSLSLFFQMPFLAAWLFIYALIYYSLARTGREHLILYVTCFFAVVYLAFSLRDLADYRDALLVADCLGVICLLAGSISQQSLNWFFLIQPSIWLGLFFLMFRHEDGSIENLDPDCAVISSWCVILFAGFSALAWQRKFYSAWTWILPFAFASFLLLTNIHYPLAVNFQNLFLLGLTLPRYFMGEFFLALALLCVAKLYRQWLPRASLLWLDGISLVLIALALVDLRLSQIMGIRFDWQAVAFGADMKMVWRVAKPFLPGIAAGLIFVIALYAIVIGLWQKGPVSKSLRLDPPAWFLLGAFLLLGFAGIWLAPGDKAEGESAILLAETNPLVQKASNPVMEKKAFMDTVRQLGMESMLQRPADAPARPTRRLNVVLIFQESSYNKYLSLFDGKEDTQPLLAKYKNRMEVFPDFFSNYAASINARFAALTGLYPVADYTKFTVNHVYVKSLFDILDNAGYHCSVFYSSFLDYTGFRDLLNNRGVEAMYDADNMPGRQNEPSVVWGLHEQETCSAIRSQIEQYATNHQTFFLTYVPVAPHNPFDGVPGRFRKFNLKRMDDYTPLYLNDLVYMDWCITSILDQLKTSGLLDNTLVIITDDHGEMLGEDGGPIGHGWMATPELTNIPLIIMDPGNPGYHVNDTIGSQVDLLPTILDLLGLPTPENQLCQGASLYSSTAQADRTIYLNSFQQYGIIEGHRYLCGDREIQTGSSPNDSFLKSYAIKNNGANTSFPELPPSDEPAPAIVQFDQFQENFLKNYTAYCQMIGN